MVPAEAPQVSPRLGEVIAAASAEFTVHCYELYGAAPLGALVRTSGDAPAYAIVCNVLTEGVDPSRKPVARGQGLEDEAAVYRDNPQIAKLLHTEFQAAIVGHRDSSGLHHGLPPSPPRIHAFVLACTPEEVRAFTQRLDFLPLLLSNGGAPPLSDQATAAFLRQAAAAHENPHAFLVGAGRQIARLLARDQQRLQPILQGLII